MKKRNWQPYEHQFIRDNYLIMSYKEIAGMLNRPTNQVGWKARWLGLSKPKEMWQFTKGQTPHNKGDKRWEVSSKELRRYKIKGKWLSDEELFLKENYLKLSR